MAIQKSKRLQPLHPGEVLKELLSEAGLTVNALPQESQLSDRGRMLIHDVLMQTVAEIESGYTPKATALVLPEERRRFQRLREHVAEHLPKYIVALIGAIAVIVAALLRRS
jgi:hypothetical protein